VAVDYDDGRPVVRWCFTEGVEFTDSFFDQTIDRCRLDLFRLLFWRQTDIDVLGEFAAVTPGLEPSGLIFHLSRCGSTLVTQMLAGLDEALVMSEPPVIDRILRSRTDCPQISEDDIVRWVRWMASALGQPRHPGQTRFVVKLDAWAVLQWPLIRRAFPHAPCLFLYRDPLEVMVSHLGPRGHRGYHMIPGTLRADLVGFSLPEAQSMTPERFCATILGRLGEAALDAAHQGQMTLVHYDSLPASVPETIGPLFGLDAASCEGMADADIVRRNAKNRSIPFVVDGDDKRRQATPAVRAAVEAEVRPVYDALETLRSGGS
jgi:hypothetical protein